MPSDSGRVHLDATPSYEGVFGPVPAPAHGSFSHEGMRMTTYTWACTAGGGGTKNTEPRQLMVLVHGFGEHLGRYRHVAAYFAARGYEVVGIDHLCHGLSDGMRRARGKLKSMNVLVKNWRAYVDAEVSPRQFAAGHVVYAHSTGGLVAFLALARQDGWRESWKELRGVVLSAPLLRSPIGALYVCPCVVRALLRPATSLRIPGAKHGQLSTLAAAEEATRADPLYWGWTINGSFIRALLEGSVESLRLLESASFPFLVLQAPGDQLVAASGAEELYRKAATPSEFKDIEVDAFRGWQHELHNHAEWSRPLDRAHKWLDRARAPTTPLEPFGAKQAAW